MIEAVALILVALFALFVTIVCSYGLFAPERMMSFVTGVWNKPSGLMTAVLVRILVGLSLIFAASNSRFPTAFLVLGIIVLIAAIGIMLAGRERVNQLIAWSTGRTNTVLRLWLLFGVLFGLFLIFSVL